MSDARETGQLSDWLASRTPSPPSQLSARLAELVGDRSSAADDIARGLIGVAKHTLSSIGDDRSAALDLLAADALITYAIEAAVETGDVDATALDAIREISSTVTE